MTKKWITMLVVIAVSGGILLLTFQGPAETKELTLKAQGMLEQIDIHIEEKPLRHYIHYVLYLVLGLAVCAVCITRGWKLGTGALIGSGIGVIDESLKVLLPTREFDATDLMRDFIGVAVAMLVIKMMEKRSINTLYRLIAGHKRLCYPQQFGMWK